MKIPQWLAVAAVGAMLALEAWQLQMIVDVKTEIASLNTKLEMHMRETPPQQHASNSLR